MLVASRHTVTIKLTAEELAKMLYCSRTIDFDPAKCKCYALVAGDNHITLEIRR